LLRRTSYLTRESNDREPLRFGDAFRGHDRQRAFVELLKSGALDLTEVRCSCSESKIGTKQCNYGRKCGLLTVNDKNIGDILIAEELAMPFVCSKSKCPRMPDWPRIIENYNK
jgi:hypothetical protein